VDLGCAIRVWHSTTLSFFAVFIKGALRCERIHFVSRLDQGGGVASTIPIRRITIPQIERWTLSHAAATAGAHSDHTSHRVRSFFDDELITPEVEIDGLPTR
jgi:hypothetical protein